MSSDAPKPAPAPADPQAAKKPDTPAFTSLTVVSEAAYEGWLAKEATALQKAFCATPGFNGRGGQVQPVYKNRKVDHYIVVVKDAATLRSYEPIPGALPPGKYNIGASSADIDHSQLTLGWILGTYRFDNYMAGRRKEATHMLRIPPQADKAMVNRLGDAITRTRNLINIPTNDMGVTKLAAYAGDLAKMFNARAKVTMAGNDRIFPLLWHVGKAAKETPRMVEIEWGDGAPGKLNLTLIGKGVVYDTGGLALKPRDSMLTMKKDMGGAAHALGLAQLIMDENLPVNLRVIIPVVENAINERALRNGDIIRSRSGKSIEIVNTDAEGRLILADALTLAGEGAVKPDLIIDFATLTAAARTVGEPGTPVIICDDKALARELEDIGEAIDDRLQAIHLDARNAGKVAGAQADLANSGTSLPSHVFAAHFLNAFSPKGVTRIHVDQSAWGANGAQDQGLRATYALIRRKALAPA